MHDMKELIRVFIGYEPRQPLAYNVLQHSIVRHASRPVSITPLILSQLPIKRRGLTEFTYSRFLVPYLCGFKGQAVFMDADMVVQGDIAELFDRDNMSAVSVMQDQPKFEWASVMHFNCGSCLRLTPEFIEDEKNKPFDLAWAPSVGELPPEWNYCVGYADWANDTDPGGDIKLAHYTQGLPCWYETSGPNGHHEDRIWERENELMSATVDWKTLMGNSVHAEPVLRRMFARLTK